MTVRRARKQRILAPHRSGTRVAACLLTVGLALLPLAACPAENAAQTVTISGTVIGNQEAPVAGAEVTLYWFHIEPSGDSFEIEYVDKLSTGADGAFTFTAAPAGDAFGDQAIVIADKDGLALGWANWHRRAEREIEIMLGEPAALTGRIVDEEGQPVAAAEVMVQYIIVTARQQPTRYLLGEAAQKLFRTTTRADGTFALNRVPAEATAELAVRAPGRGTVQTFDPMSHRGDALQYSANQADIRIAMPREGVIKGNAVEHGTGKPVPGLPLKAARDRHGPALEKEGAVTNDKGEFRIGQLAPGSYQLRMAKTRDAVSDWVAVPVPVTVEAGETVRGLTIEVSKGGVLEVVVTDAANNTPLADASVMVSDQARPQPRSRKTDAQGLARFQLPAGEYRVNWIRKETYTFQRSDDPLVVEDGKTERVEIQLSGQPKLKGVVRDEAGAPVEGATVSILPGGMGATETDAQGRFEAQWDPRRWTGRELQMYALIRHQERSLAMAAEIGEETDTLEIALQPGGTLTGRVVDPQGKPIAGAVIVAMLNASGWSAPASREMLKTDADGRYEITTLPRELGFKVQASAAGYGQENVDAEFADPNSDRAEVADIELKIANRSVSGTVVDEDDNDVANADVHLFGPGQAAQSTRTDKNGKFTFDKVCEGEVNINANVRTGQTYGSATAQAGADDVKVVLSQRASPGRAAPKLAPSLLGKALPDFKDITMRLTRETLDDRVVLLCFWDTYQRPSRHCVKELAAAAETLAAKNVTVATVHAASIDPEELARWTTEAEIALPVGVIEAKADKVRHSWGVRGLPWLILTDKKHVIRAEGFGIQELDATLDAVLKE